MKYLKNIKNLFNEENKTSLIGLLTILILLWSILYLIPEIFMSLFNTFLGNIILLITVMLIGSNNYKYGILIGLIFVIIYRFSYLSSIRENFTWSNKATTDFLLIQDTINPGIVFDVNMIQESQASQEELDYFNKNGKWPWSQEVKKLYTEAVLTNPFIRTSPEDAINHVRTIYNQTAILRILSTQTKEGQFLLNGVLVQDPKGNKMEDLPSGFGDFGYKSGLIGPLNKDVIRCKMNDNGSSTLERITYTGKGGILNEQTKEVSDVDYNDLENIIPGFSFVNGPCNPCVAINNPPEYSCPFKLKVQNKPIFVSGVWEYLWGIKINPLVSEPSFLNEKINSKEFPLLSELQTELNKQKTLE